MRILKDVGRDLEKDLERRKRGVSEESGNKDAASSMESMVYTATCQSNPTAWTSDNAEVNLAVRKFSDEVEEFTWGD